MNNEYKSALWEKKSEKGTTYFNGKIKIENKEYRITLFKNNKQNEKQPDFNIIIRENEKKKASSSDYEEFGKMLNIDDELLDD